jgi:hypothetical protein
VPQQYGYDLTSLFDARLARADALASTCCCTAWCSTAKAARSRTR